MTQSQFNKMASKADQIVEVKTSSDLLSVVPKSNFYYGIANAKLIELGYADFERNGKKILLVAAS